MIPQPHKELILRLLKPGQQLIDEMTPEKANILHAIIGLCGEAAGEVEAAVLPLRQMNVFIDGHTNWWDPVQGMDYVWPGIDRENMLEELGDLLFYEGAFREFTGTDSCSCYPPSSCLWVHERSPAELAKLPHYPKKKIACDLIGALTVATGRLTDVAKKHVMYAQELNSSKLVQAISDFNWAISQLAVLLGFTEMDVRQHNIDKLNKRYPEGYNDQAAKDRVDKKGGDDADH
jgi:hypothetical protein